MAEDMTVRNLSPVIKRFQRLMVDNGVACGMSQSGNVWDNVAMESVFSSLKTRIGRKIYRMRDQVRADVFG
jgi:putative transposase